MRLTDLRRASLATFVLVPFVFSTEVSAFARPLAGSPTPPPSLVLVLDAPTEAPTDAPGAPAATDATATFAPDVPIRPPAQRTGAIGKLTILVLALVGLVVLAAVVIVALVLFDLTSNEI